MMMPPPPVPPVPVVRPNRRLRHRLLPVYPSRRLRLRQQVLVLPSRRLMVQNRLPVPPVLPVQVEPPSRRPDLPVVSPVVQPRAALPSLNSVVDWRCRPNRPGRDCCSIVHPSRLAYRLPELQQLRRRPNRRLDCFELVQPLPARPNCRRSFSAERPNCHCRLMKTLYPTNHLPAELLAR